MKAISPRTRSTQQKRINQVLITKFA